MTKKLLTIGILILTVIIGLVYFAQNTQNKQKEEIVSTDKVIQKTQEKNTVSNQRKETLKENQVPEEKVKEFDIDSDIDTSNWNHHNVGAISIMYPKDWYYHDYNIISNRDVIVDQNGNHLFPKYLRKNEIRISISGAPMDIMDGEDADIVVENKFNEIVENNNWSCDIITNIVTRKLARCKSINDAHIKYFQILYMKPPHDFMQTNISIIANDIKTLEFNSAITDVIIDSLYLFSKKFIPSSVR